MPDQTTPRWLARVRTAVTVLCELSIYAGVGFLTVLVMT